MSYQFSIPVKTEGHAQLTPHAEVLKATTLWNHAYQLLWEITTHGRSSYRITVLCNILKWQTLSRFQKSREVFSDENKMMVRIKNHTVIKLLHDGNTGADNWPSA